MIPSTNPTVLDEIAQQPVTVELADPPISYQALEIVISEIFE
jgi:hypothetical protein